MEFILRRECVNDMYCFQARVSGTVLAVFVSSKAVPFT
jgi:hypothetical protein